MHIGPTELFISLLIIVLLIWGGVRRSYRWWY